MKTTKSNKTKDETTKQIVDYFNPNGDVLDPSAGKMLFISILMLSINIVVKYQMVLIFLTLINMQIG